MDLPITLDRPLAIIDLETTGLSPEYDRIIELAMLRISPNGDVVERVRRFNPGIPITPGAMEVHGISDADVADEEPFAARARSLAKLLEGCDLGGFNIKRFDIPMLVREFERVGVPFSLEGRRIVDSQVIFHAEEPRDLTAAARFYLDRDHREAHTALGDIRITAHVLWSQLRRYEHLPRDMEGLNRYMEEARPERSPIQQWFDDRGGGEYLFRRGKHRGQLLSQVARETPDYLEWMLGADDMGAEVLEVVRAALEAARGV
jgi:DNA polymerase-3 subunit epsilon